MLSRVAPSLLAIASLAVIIEPIALDALLWSLPDPLSMLWNLCSLTPNSSAALDSKDAFAPRGLAETPVSSPCEYFAASTLSCCIAVPVADAIVEFVPSEEIEFSPMPNDAPDCLKLSPILKI